MDSINKINKRNENPSIMVCNPDLVDYVQSLNMEQVKALKGGNIIKFPGLIIIR
jgi:hypothetical protein